MKYFYTIILFTVLNIASANALTISPEPYTIYRTPNSIIHRLSKDHMQYVGGRARCSTCTGVAWFSDSRHLISANLLDHSAQTYSFNPYKKEILPIKKYDNSLTLLGWPENLSTSKDGKLLAISNSYTGKANIYRLDTKRAAIYPSPIAQLSTGDHALHGVRFSPDGKYLAYVTYDGRGNVRIFRNSSTSSDRPQFDLCCTVNCTYEGLSSKGIDFSSDQEYIAICYSAKASPKSSAATGKLAIYKFDSQNGIMNPDPVSAIGTDELLYTPEDVLFVADDSYLLVSNQGNDTITAHEFDPETGAISNSYVALKSPEAQLNFPHGFALSPDNKYLAVSNYGDDKICIYTIDSQ